jgi:hypothetical protein
MRYRHLLLSNHLRIIAIVGGNYRTHPERTPQHAPTKQAKILQRIRALRGGKLNDGRFGIRMQGEGVFADHIAALFTLGCRKAGLQNRDPQLSTAAFRRPTGAQLSLFS